MDKLLRAVVQDKPEEELHEKARAIRGPGMSLNALVSGIPVPSKRDLKEAWLKTPGLADAPSTPKEAVRMLQATEASLGAGHARGPVGHGSGATGYGGVPELEHFLEQEELRDSDRRAPEAVPLLRRSRGCLR